MRILFSFFGFLLFLSIHAQVDTGFYHHLNDSIRAARDLEFADSAHSPLEEDSIAGFTQLHYFPFNADYIFTARLEKTPGAKPFRMPTTTTRLPEYVQYGILHFLLKDDSIHLPVYRNIALSQRPDYRDYFFLPFTDSTNSFESYGGGRYLDLRIQPEDSTVVIDFNQAYNPYCAYNSRYSCPIPPRKNRIRKPIYAGVLKYGEH
ncbi:MAG: DUF1684 domain-containing protein [Bacteroidetes bacterium]|nr:MAG: DUF1684 domain-containing protein [Bacteroidota bacterium]